MRFAEDTGKQTKLNFLQNTEKTGENGRKTENVFDSLFFSTFFVEIFKFFLTFVGNRYMIYHELIRSCFLRQ